MGKIKISRVWAVLAALVCMIPAYAAEPFVTLVATDSNGMKFTIEVYESERHEWAADLIIYKNSDPSNKIYGNGTDLRRGFIYANTDSPLFDIAFPKGPLKTLSPFKTIFYIYYEKGNYFIAPKDTKDPGWRIPYVAHKKSAATTDSQLKLSDFLGQDMDMRYADIAPKLEKRGFSHSEDEYGDKFTKGNCNITYYEDFSDDGEGKKEISIIFLDIEDASKLISPLKTNKNWSMKRVSSEEIYSFCGKLPRNGKLEIRRFWSKVDIKITYP